MIDKTIKNYDISHSDKANLDDSERIEWSVQDALLNRPTSIEAQDFMKRCYDDDRWIGCSCNEGAFLFIRKTTNFLCLVRLTSRAEHKDDCPFSITNMPIYDKKLAEKIGTKTISFHRAKSSKPSSTTKAPISIKGLQAESTRLARFMFTLYDESGLNTVDLHGNHASISDQFKKIRQAANGYVIAGRKGGEILFTHPNSIDRARQFLVENKWADNQVPHVLLFFTVDSIAGREMSMSVKGKPYTIESQSKIEYFFDDASPPYNVLMSLALRPSSKEPEVLRATALPVFNKAWLLPVKNDAVRHFIKSILAMCGDGDVGSGSLIIPFFPQLYRGHEVRPDFSIDVDGESKVMIYFMSAKDEGYHARKGEMDFLRSAGFRVYGFDMDAERMNIQKDVWKAAKHFYEDYLRRDAPYGKG